jgi:hypothetical protein
MTVALSQLIDRKCSNEKRKAELMDEESRMLFQLEEARA